MYKYKFAKEKLSHFHIDIEKKNSKFNFNSNCLKIQESNKKKNDIAYKTESQQQKK